MNSRSRLSVTRLTLALYALLALGSGCEPEMPVPPPRESKNPAEDAFYWAMERMEHAMEKFRPSTSLGLSVKRELDYELFPPSNKEPNYTARVTIAKKTIYRPSPLPTATERKQAAAEKQREADKLKLDDPYGIPGENAEDFTGRDVPPAELPVEDVPDPRIPTQKLEEKKDYLLEYVDNEWKLQSTDLEEYERIWFDYALEQGEFAPGAGLVQ